MRTLRILMLAGACAEAASGAAVALEVDPEVLPEINIGGRGVVTANYRDRDLASGGNDNGGELDVADSSLLLGFSKFLFNDVDYGFATIGFKAPDDDTDPTPALLARGPGHRAIARDRVTGFGPTQIAGAQVDIAQVGATQVRVDKVGAAQIDTAQIRVAQVRAAQVTIAQVSAAQDRVAQVGLGHVGAGQHSLDHQRPAQVRADQVGATQIRVAQVGAAQIDTPQVQVFQGRREHGRGGDPGQNHRHRKEAAPK